MPGNTLFTKNQCSIKIFIFACMIYVYAIKKRCLLVVVFFSCLFATTELFGQLIYQPYTYQFYQKLNTSLYSINTNEHTSMKPYFISDSSAIKKQYDSLLFVKTDYSHKNWLKRTFLPKHQIDVKTNDYNIFFDFLWDVEKGNDYLGKSSTILNSRGFQFGATVGKNFYIYTSLYENQGKFPNYINDYINAKRLVPSEYPVNVLPYSNGSTDWSRVTSIIGYKPAKNILLTLGQDKIFIGDGYRSLLLSDNAPNYPFFKFSIDLTKSIQYISIWAYFQDRNAPNFNVFTNNRRKYGVFHYIDWNITKRASVAFFNALISEEADNQGNLHGFDLNIINPILFSPALGPSTQVADHTLAGLNVKYKLFDKTSIYGQFVMDQTINSGLSNSTGYQIGVRGSDLFFLKHLNYLFEYNTVSPSVYYGQNAIVNYTHFGDPLGDPFGANFKELLGIVNYTIDKFDFQFEGYYVNLANNLGYNDYGSEIQVVNYVNLPQIINNSGVGVPATIKFAEGTLGYMLNPKYNLKIEVGALLRQEKSSQTDTKTALLTIGFKSGFRNLYRDF